jgi:hypothetical protein
MSQFSEFVLIFKKLLSHFLIVMRSKTRSIKPFTDCVQSSIGDLYTGIKISSKMFDFTILIFVPVTAFRFGD